MQVCNHPDLFATRAIVSPFDMREALTLDVASACVDIVRQHSATWEEPAERLEQGSTLHQLVYLRHYATRSRLLALDVDALQVPAEVIEDVSDNVNDPRHPQYATLIGLPAAAEGDQTVLLRLTEVKADRLAWRKASRARMSAENRRRRQCIPLTGDDDGLIRLVSVVRSSTTVHHALSSWTPRAALPRHTVVTHPELRSSQLAAARPLVLTLEQRVEATMPLITSFTCIIPRARASPASLFFWRNPPSPSMPTHAGLGSAQSSALHSALFPSTALLRPSFIRQQLSFPDKLLLQFDCGKLQVLDRMLRSLHAEHHRCLIFTQFTRMLDVLEQFLSIYSYPYLRLDGSTKPEERQQLMEKFNQSPKYFVMLLSTRSGGVGVNLTGADTVIFYDNVRLHRTHRGLPCLPPRARLTHSASCLAVCATQDWNPAMDLQAQDRCHRIGQTREVNIYRLVTEHSIEENILRKSNQKRHMNEVVIGDGNFSTEFLEKLDPRELLGVDQHGQRTADEANASDAKVDAADGVVEEPQQDEEDESLAKVTGKKDQYSAEEVQAMMMNLEDESDRTALINVQAELEAERAEFAASSSVSSARPLPGVGGRSAAGRASSASASASSVYAKLSGHHSASFENALTPVQRYALYFAEHVDPVVTEKQIVRTARLMEKDEAKWEAKQGLPSRPSHSSPSPSPPPPLSAASMDWSGKEEKDERKAPADLSAFSSVAGGSVVKMEPMDRPPPPPSLGSGEAGAALSSPSHHLNVLGNRETFTHHSTDHPTHPLYLPPSSSALSTAVPPSTDPSSAVARPARTFKRKRVTFEDAEVLQYLNTFLHDRRYNDPKPRPSVPLPPFDLLPPPSVLSADDDADADALFYQYTLTLPEFERRFAPALTASASLSSAASEALLRKMHDSTLQQLQPVYEQRGFMFETDLYEALHLQVDDDPYVDTALPPLAVEEDELPVPFATPSELQRMLGRHADAMAFSFRAGVQSSRAKVRSQYAQYRVARKQMKDKRRERALFGAWLHRRDLALCHAYEVHAAGTQSMYVAREKARQVIEMEVDNDGDPWVLRIPRSRLRGYHRSAYGGGVAAAKDEAASSSTTAASASAAAGAAPSAVASTSSSSSSSTSSSTSSTTTTGIRDSQPLKPAIPQGSLAHYHNYITPLTSITSLLLAQPSSSSSSSSTSSSSMSASASSQSSSNAQPPSAAAASAPPKPVAVWRGVKEGLFASFKASAASASLFPPARVRPPSLDEVTKALVPWTVEEDHLLQAVVREHGQNWALAQMVLSSNPRVCGRLRSVKDVHGRWLLLQQRRDGGGKRKGDGQGDDDDEADDKDAAVKDDPDERVRDKDRDREREKDKAKDKDKDRDRDHHKADKDAKKRDKDKDKDRDKDKDKDKDRERERERGDKGDKAKSDKKKDKGERLSKEDKKKYRKEEKAAAAAERRKKEKLSHALLPSGFGARCILGFIERDMRLIKSDQVLVKTTLRSSLQQTSPAAYSGDDQGTQGGSSKPTVQITHPSHKQAIHDAHGRLGLPPSAMGKTLMPHQVIQLRARRQQQEQARAQQQRLLQQQQQQQMVSGAPPPGLLPLSTSPAPGGAPLDDKQRMAMQQQQRSYQQSGMSRPPPGSAINSGQPGGSNGGSMPSMRPMPSATGPLPPPSSGPHIPSQSRSSSMTSSSSQYPQDRAYVPPPPSSNRSSTTTSPYPQNLQQQAASTLPLPHGQYAQPPYPPSLSPNPSLPFSSSHSGQYPPPTSVSPVPTSASSMGVPQSPKGSRGRGAPQRAVKQPAGGRAAGAGRGRSGAPGGGPGGGGGPGDMQIDSSAMQVRGGGGNGGPGLSPPPSSSSTVYSQYPSGPPGASGPYPAPPGSSQYPPPTSSSSPAYPQQQQQQQARGGYPNQLPPPHRPSTPNSAGYPPPPSSGQQSYPHPGYPPSSSSHPHPSEYSNSRGHYPAPQGLEPLPPMGESHLMEPYLAPQQQPGQSRPPSASHPPAQGAYPAANLPSRSPAPAHLSPYPYDGPYDGSHQGPAASPSPSLSPSLPAERNPSPLPPQTTAAWLKQVYVRYPHYSEQMQLVLRRTDLSEQQKVDSIARIIGVGGNNAQQDAAAGKRVAMAGAGDEPMSSGPMNAAEYRK